MAFDISSITEQQKSKLLLQWYSDNQFGLWPYDYNIYPNDANGIPKNYSIEVNTSKDTTSPENNWTTVLSVNNNSYHSRQHLINATGANWIRINVTSVRKVKINPEFDKLDANTAKFAFKISDGQQSLHDDWLFLGDSITQSCMAHKNDIDPGYKDFSDLVHELDNSHLPVFENGGIQTKKSQTAVANIDKWLQMFPGKYIVLSYGTNDTDHSIPPRTSPEIFGSNIGGLVYKILLAGRTPVIPYIPWGKSNHAEVVKYNAQIEKIYKDFPQVLRGPNLYTLFEQHQEWLNPADDEVHPNNEGCLAIRKMWADFAVNTAYKTNSPFNTESISAPSISSPAPSQTSTTPNSPIGYEGGSNCTQLIGWACDSDNYNEALDIHVYLDNPAYGPNPGKLILNTKANKTINNATGAYCGGKNNRWYAVNTPSILKDGKEHKLYIYPIDIPFNPGKINQQIEHSPIKLTCQP